MVDASNLASNNDNELDDRDRDLTSTNHNAGILTLDQYFELFGDSDDTDISFHGFDEDLQGMKGPELTPKKRQVAGGYLKDNYHQQMNQTRTKRNI